MSNIDFYAESDMKICKNWIENDISQNIFIETETKKCILR